MATVSKSNRPRKGSLLTRNGRTRLSPLTIAQLVVLMGKTTSKKANDKIRSRLNVLEKRVRKLAKTV